MNTKLNINEILKLKKEYESKITEIYEQKETEINKLELSFKTSFFDVELQNIVLEQKIENFQKEIVALLENKNKNESVINSFQENLDSLIRSLEEKLHQSKVKSEDEHLKLMKRHAEEIKNFKLELKTSLNVLQSDYFKDIDQRVQNISELETRVDKYLIDLNICNIENHYLKNNAQKLEKNIAQFQAEIKVLNKKLFDQEKELCHIKQGCVYYAQLSKQFKQDFSKTNINYQEEIKKLNALNLELMNESSTLKLQIDKQKDEITATNEQSNNSICNLIKENKISEDNYKKELDKLANDFLLSKELINKENQEKIIKLEQSNKEMIKEYKQKLNELQIMNQNKMIESAKILELEKKKYNNLSDRFNSVRKQHLKEKNNLILKIDETKKSMEEEIKKIHQEYELTKNKETIKLKKDKNTENIIYEEKIKLIVQNHESSFNNIQKKYEEECDASKRMRIEFNNEIKKMNNERQILIDNHFKEIEKLKLEYHLRINHLFSNQRFSEEKVSEEIFKKFAKLEQFSKTESLNYKNQIINMNLLFMKKMSSLKKIYSDYLIEINILKKDCTSLRRDITMLTNQSMSQIQVIFAVLKKLNGQLENLKHQVCNKNMEIKSMKEKWHEDESMLKERLQNVLPIDAQERYESIILSLKCQINLLKEQLGCLQNQISIMSNESKDLKMNTKTIMQDI